MTNLYDETIKTLKTHGKTFNDVEWIGYKDAYITRGNFIDVAKRTNYDNSFGTQEIPIGLIIVGHNWWLERRECDSSELWEFKTLPTKPTHTIEINNITDIYRKNYYKDMENKNLNKSWSD